MKYLYNTNLKNIKKLKNDFFDDLITNYLEFYLKCNEKKQIKINLMYNK
jgi:hypothetical protein